MKIRVRLIGQNIDEKKEVFFFIFLSFFCPRESPGNLSDKGDSSETPALNMFKLAGASFPLTSFYEHNQGSSCFIETVLTN